MAERSSGGATTFTQAGREMTCQSNGFCSSSPLGSLPLQPWRKRISGASLSSRRGILARGCRVRWTWPRLMQCLQSENVEGFVHPFWTAFNVRDDHADLLFLG